MNTDVNVPLLRKVVEWAEAEAAKPKEFSEWEQGAWIIPTNRFDEPMETDEGVLYYKDHSCGTCFCIAGKTVELSLEPGERICAETNTVIRADGTSEDIQKRAVDTLGLPTNSDLWDNDLFRATNSIETVREIAEELAGERL